MSKVNIYNDADESWLTTLEQRAYLLLPSLGSNFSRITVKFREIPARGLVPRRYRCTVCSSVIVARSPSITAEHPNGEVAIDGAMQRFRRQVERSRMQGSHGIPGFSLTYQTD